MPHKAYCGPSRYSFRILVLSSVLLFVLLWPVASFARGDDTDERDFISSLGAIIYGFAWPSATYERMTFGSISEIDGGSLLRFRLHGRSAFGGGPLWVDVLVEMKGGQITDLRWGSHNAILMPPGETVKALGAMLEELNRQQSSPSPPPASTATGYAFRFTNRCRHPVQLAIRYETMGGQWVTDGWWRFKPGEVASLQSEKGVTLKSNRGTWYYFAETTNSANLIWRGSDLVAKVGAREVGMYRLDDKEGDNDWNIHCEGF